MAWPLAALDAPRGHALCRERFCVSVVLLHRGLRGVCCHRQGLDDATFRFCLGRGGREIRRLQPLCGLGRGRLVRFVLSQRRSGPHIDISLVGEQVVGPSESVGAHAHCRCPGMPRINARYQESCLLTTAIHSCATPWPESTHRVSGGLSKQETNVRVSPFAFEV